MPLKSPFESSFGVTRERRILLVELIAEGLHGWGEVTTDEGPFYNSEDTDTGWHVISEFIAPLLAGKTLVSASQFPEMVDGLLTLVFD